MGNATKYWTFLRLEPTGSYRGRDRPEAKTYLLSQWGAIAAVEASPDEATQSQLFTQMGTATTEPETLAQLCLRCCISHQIVQVCTALVNQFGTNYRFHLTDLLPLVLDDAGRMPMDNYPSLAKQILQKFQPSSGTLGNWVTRLVRQHREVNQFLLERGLYLVSDWAILNDTPVERLQRILTEFHALSTLEIAQASALLDSYHAIYRSDRLQQRQQQRQGPRRSAQCQPPTPEQLQRMCDRLHQQTGKPQAPATVHSQLQTLAQRLRQHRIAVRSGTLPTQSTDSPDMQATLTSPTLVADQPDDIALQNEFLHRYRQLFVTALDQALETVVQDRLAKARNPEKADQFLRALELFYCQRRSMTEIATAIGVPRQDNVTYLLKLKDLRADVRHLMLQALRSTVIEQARQYTDPDHLDALNQTVDEALNQQVEQMMQSEEKRAKTPKEFMQDTLFAQRLCGYLDRLLGG
jgi:hypothetical protein